MVCRESKKSCLAYCNIRKQDLKLKKKSGVTAIPLESAEMSRADAELNTKDGNKIKTMQSQITT